MIIHCMGSYRLDIQAQGMCRAYLPALPADLSTTGMSKMNK